MSNLMVQIFGPLDKKACGYFHIISAIYLVLMIFFCFTAIVFIFRKYKNITFSLIMYSAVMFINLFLAYFVNRLLFTMCNKSLA